MDTNTDAITLAVVASKIDGVREDIGELRREVADVKREAVSRGEWVQRNNHVDGRFVHVTETFNAQGREIAQLRTDTHTQVASVKAEIAARRAPWTSVGALVVAVFGALYAVFGPNIP